MTGNIVGEEFKEYVFKQIDQRQKDQFSGYDLNRTPEQLQYLNNKTSWVKLASGMEIVEEDGGLERLKSIIGDGDLVDQFRGTELAQKTILFNGTSETEPAVYQDGKKIEKLAEYNFRSGYSKTKSIWNFNSVYGLGGTDFGQQPMPGITGVTVKSLNRGSIREANVQIKVYNKYQFALLELLYLRIGFTMMLEWGNDKFINNDGELQKMGNTIIEDLWFQDSNSTQLEMIGAIERYRGIYSANYDGFFGKVVNFTWTFNSDGSYDIDLKLITVGDVVESLQANIPVGASDVASIQLELTGSQEGIQPITGIQNLIDTPIVNSAQNNKIGRYLFSTIGTPNIFKEDEEYYSAYEGFKSAFERTSRSSGMSLDDSKLIKSNNKYYYYMTFGELLTLCQNNIIPGIKTGDFISPQLDIEKDEWSNKIAYFPNQISLDPRVCIFKPVFGDLGEDNPRFRISGISTPEYLLGLKDYVSSTKGGILYGKLMNLYLNYNFISESLIANTKDGKLSVFKFFQRICDGINSALGNINNIEPIIKDDKIVTFIDQNPIPGYLEEIHKDKKYIADLEVYGYNPDKKRSNFVKDISFKTSITPQLASMISIGTTAGGSSTKNEDGTAFSYWNEGLRDRFAPELIDPPEKLTKEERAKEERVNFLAKLWEDKSYWVIFAGDDVTDDNEYKVFEKTEYGRDKRGIKYSPVQGIYSVKEFIDLMLANDAYLEANKDVITQSELSAEQNNNFALYLADAFGGNTQIKVQSLSKSSRGGYYVKENIIKVDSRSAKYLRYDSNFIARGKTTFKNYINSITKEIYDTPDINNPDDKSNRTPSNQIGFIPVGFNLTLEGISGIKIYNKLNINNSFLPQQYPKALKFLIQKVDHKIQDNTWETDLDTLSIPNTKEIIKGDITNFYQKIQQVQTGLLPENERGPKPTNKPFRIICRRQELAGYTLPSDEYFKQQYLSSLNPNTKTHPNTIDRAVRNLKSKYPNEYILATSQQIINSLNSAAQPAFKKFFDYLENNYKGYTAQINDIGRTIEESKALKQKNSSNADPGYSRHNYYAGIDMNIITPEGRTLMKAEKNLWINHGFDKAASENGLIWGGTFAGYVDSIHFGLEFNIDTAVANATSKYGSIDNMKGNDGKNVKLT